MGGDGPMGPGWWQASDGTWYAPELHPNAKQAVQLPAPSWAPPQPGRPASPQPTTRSTTSSRPQYATHTVTVSRQGAPGPAASVTSTIGNILWLVLAGWWLAIGYVVSGLLNMITIIGIPFGIQAFKLAGYALWPFGRVVIDRPGSDAGLSCLGNVIWFILGGFLLALGHLFAGVILCITIIGIPLGLASFKMAGLAIAPFGKQIVSRSQLASMGNVVVVSSV